MKNFLQGIGTGILVIAFVVIQFTVPAIIVVALIKYILT